MRLEAPPTNMINNTKATAARQFRQAILTVFGSDTRPAKHASESYATGQVEVCPTTGKRHWQIFVQLDKKFRTPTIQKMYGHGEDGVTVWVKAVEVNNGADTYCNKDDTYANDDSRFTRGTKRENKGPACGAARYNQIRIEMVRKCATWEEVLDIPGIANVMRWAEEVWRICVSERVPARKVVNTLRNWQRKAVGLIDTQNEREVLFIVDQKGGRGKTELAQWLLERKEATCFVSESGGHKDVAYNWNFEDIGILDMARANKGEHWPWGIIEGWKNGFITSAKYHSQTKRRSPVKVCVFCNNIPEDIQDKLSADRIIIWGWEGNEFKQLNWFHE